jgi:hypothetical protein
MLGDAGGKLVDILKGTLIFIVEHPQHDEWNVLGQQGAKVLLGDHEEVRLVQQLGEDCED